jgi:four helix bundle protein
LTNFFEAGSLFVARAPRNEENMPLMKSFRELEVWQKAHALVLDIYRITESFPERERFGITSQLRRAAASIPANIAEDFGRRSTRELWQFLAIGNGSLEETRYFLVLARDLHFLTAERFQSSDQQCNSAGQMLGALARSPRNRSASGFHGIRATGHETRVNGARHV